MNELHPRIEKLEESHAFAERTSEQLSEELRTAFARIERLEKRLGALDDRLLRLGEAVTDSDRSIEDDVPPHSGNR